MNRIAKILLGEIIPDRYVRRFCVITGAVMACAGVVLIFSGHHGLLFVLLGSICVAGSLPPGK